MGLYLMYCIFSSASFMYCQKWLKHPCAQQPLFCGFFLLSFLVLFHFTTFLLNKFRHLIPTLAFLLTGFGALVHLFYTLGRYQSLGPIHSLSYWRNNFHCIFWTIGFSYFVCCSGKRISSQASTTLVGNIYLPEGNLCEPCFESAFSIRRC